jgi:AhpD family alkylhydroperoxidase
MDPFKELAPMAFEVLVRQNQEVMAHGALPTRVKELIAVALSISTRCEPCLRVNVSRAREAGATPEEVAETIAVATLMEGGPACEWSKRTMAELYSDEPTGD